MPVCRPAISRGAGGNRSSQGQPPDREHVVRADPCGGVIRSDAAAAIGRTVTRLHAVGRRVDARQLLDGRRVTAHTRPHRPPWSSRTAGHPGRWGSWRGPSRWPGRCARSTIRPPGRRHPQRLEPVHGQARLAGHVDARQLLARRAVGLPNGIPDGDPGVAARHRDPVGRRLDGQPRGPGIVHGLRRRQRGGRVGATTVPAATPSSAVTASAAPVAVVILIATAISSRPGGGPSGAPRPRRPGGSRQDTKPGGGSAGVVHPTRLVSGPPRRPGRAGPPGSPRTG